MFPCFDDPALKARFSIEVLVDQNFQCLSNMPILSRHEIATGECLHVFEETPPMSTYVSLFQRFHGYGLSNVNG